MTKSGGQFALASPLLQIMGTLSPVLRDLRPWLYPFAHSPVSKHYVSEH